MSDGNRRGGTTRVKRVGNYIIGKTLGEGTFGKVKLGTHILTGEKVALKILEKDRIKDVAEMERVTREIHILKLINHQNVVRLLEVIDTPKHIYLIMEYLAGGELFDYIVAHTRVKEREACQFFHQIINGVDYVHHLHIIHRDLKPENLLLDSKKNLKIADFGLSNLTKPGHLLKTACGSPCYAAPEMIAGKEYVGTGVDVWSLGVILFALICGYLPFEDNSTPALYDKILHGRYTTPNFISEDAKDLIRRMLTTDPRRRINIAQLRQHRWYRMHPSDEDVLPDDNESLIKSPDMSIIKELEGFGFDPDYAVKCLTQNKHNQLTATYFLLLAKRAVTGEKPKTKREERRRSKVEDSKKAPPVQFKTGALKIPEYAGNKKKEQVKAPEVGAPLNLTSIGEDTEYNEETVDKAQTQVKAPEARPPPAARGGRRHSVAVGVPGAVPPPAGKTSVAQRLANRLVNIGGKKDEAGVGHPPARSGAVAAAAAKQKAKRGRRMSVAEGGEAVAAAAAAAQRHATGRGPAPSADGGLRTYRGAFNVSTTSSKPPKLIMAEIQSTLAQKNIAFKQVSSYAVKCEDPKYLVRFEMEICKLDAFDNLYVVHLKRITGDTWVYKELCGRLISSMKL